MNLKGIEYWTHLLDLACEDGELSSCIPGKDERGRICQFYLFESEEGATRFCERIMKSTKLPLMMLCRPIPEMLGLRFCTTFSERAALSALTKIPN